MGWIRTCFSLIAFGFAIFAFFLTADGSREGSPAKPLFMCLALTLGGSMFLALAVIHHHLALKQQSASGLEKKLSLAKILAILLCAAGLFGSWVILIEF